MKKKIKFIPASSLSTSLPSDSTPVADIQGDDFTADSFMIKRKSRSEKSSSHIDDVHFSHTTFCSKIIECASCYEQSDGGNGPDFSLLSLIGFERVNFKTKVALCYNA